MKWYVIHTFSGFEKKVQTAIEKGLEGTELAQKVGRIMVPVRKTFIIRDGKKVERERKVFAGYVILEAELSPELKTYIMGIAGVNKFLGMTKTQKDPTPLSKEEIDRVMGIAEPDMDSKTFTYMPGDMVKVISGPFTDFEGVVQKTSDEGTKLVIDVTVFGRRTPVELSGNQVELVRK